MRLAFVGGRIGRRVGRVESRQIDDVQNALTGLHVPGENVDRDAGKIRDLRAAAREQIEERRFSGVGAPDEDDRGHDLHVPSSSTPDASSRSSATSAPDDVRTWSGPPNAARRITRTLT